MIKNKKTYLKILLIMMVMLIAVSTQTFAATISKVTGLSAKITGEKVYLEWNTVSNASGYEIHIKIPGVGYTYIGSVTTNHATVAGFREGATYVAKIKAYKNVNGTKSYADDSSEVEIKIPTTTSTKIEKVQNLKVNVENTKAKLTWDNVANASGYEVYVDIPEIGYTYLGSVNRNAVSITGFTKGKAYAVKIRAYQNVNGQKEYGDFSSEVKIEIQSISSEEAKIDTVKGLNAKVTGTKVDLSWNKVSGADGYEIYMTIPSYGSTVITTTSTNRTITGITETRYNYTVKVRAYKYVNGVKKYGEYSSTVSFKGQEETTLAKVTGLSAKVTGTRVDLSWNKVSNADGYEIYMTIPSYGNTVITTTSTNRTITGITETRYNYTVKVRAYKYVNGVKKYGEYSNTVSFKGQEETTLAKATGLSAKVIGTRVDLSWNKVSNADGYEIYMTIPSYGNTVITTTSTNRTITGITETRYNYTVKVRAYKYVNGVKKYGEYSSTVSFKGQEETTLAKATGLSAKVTGTRVDLSWNKVSNADGYEIYMTIPSYGNTVITTTSTNRTITGITETRYNYTVKVRAYKYVNGVKKYGEYSSTVSFKGQEETTLAKVTGLSGKVTGTQVDLNWNKVSGADGYEINMVIPGYGSTNMTTTSTSRVVSGLTTYGESYTTKVRAYKYVNGQKVYGEYSNSIEVYRK